MKVHGKGLVFRGSLPWFTRRRLPFLRKGNTVHLLETALVVEGYRQRLYLPVIDALFRRALCEWTTVTIPYSRILDYRYRRMLARRIIAMLVVWLPLVLMVLGVAGGIARNGALHMLEGILVCVGYALGGAVLTFYLLREALAPRNRVLYRQADGKRALLVFSIRPPKRQEEFARTIERHREVASGREGA